MDELLEKAGEMIAKLTGVPAAYMAGSDPQKAKQLSYTSGMRDELLSITVTGFIMTRLFA